MILQIKGEKPSFDETVFVAPNATVIGDIILGEHSSVWFGAVVRGDSNSIRIGARTNIQDLCILHVDSDHKLVIEDDITVGHRATLHGCTVKERVLIGMGATVMNGAVVGSDSIVGAGSLVTQGMQVPPRSLVLGVPAKIRRELTNDELALIKRAANHYVEYAMQYMREAHAL